MGIRGVKVCYRRRSRRSEGAGLIDEYLDCFPGVTREQAVAVQEYAEKLTVQPAALRPCSTTACPIHRAAYCSATPSALHRRWAGDQAVSSASYSSLMKASEAHRTRGHSVFD
jgi:hypothetical protein